MKKTFYNFYICLMIDLNEIKKIISGFKPEMESKYFVSSIGLFGSVVRNDFNKNSDIDIIVDFNGRIGIEFITLADELEKRLNHKVDLVSRGGIKEKYFNVIEPEIAYV
ncbi:MAG: polymerase beta domain protein region [Mucilaginibacter sp.]|nr:polymerase beta domain protein region [Mucilaginibacter sp.]